MLALTIEARSLRSARQIENALRRFAPKLIADNGSYQVRIALEHSDGQVVALLHTLAEHVSSRGGGSTRVELDGESYTLDA